MGVLHFIVKNLHQVLFLTWEHIFMVTVSLIIAMAIGVPLGVLITKRITLAKRVINSANIIMTVPSIALFGLMMPILALIGQGLGKVPAIIALVLYSQLPIIRNTYVAINNVPPSLRDAGRGMGMNRWELLKEVEIPIAVPVIIAGLRTAAVMNIGIAAIAAYIGAGGLGVYIQQGIDRVYPEMIISGAVLVSLLAIVIDGLMAGAEHLLTPKGIQLQKRLA
ncbi:MAG: choline ABC transporter permease [Deltaproteobacteria bacterium]|nr:MAG: choline ABC transporter permease [Desulfobacteraceae bacterium 4484_190.3]RLB16871.1 MAG: choline ABC transporter permease [Deltaproteobacteria bacterium]